MKRFTPKPWMGLLGFLGFVGFIPNHRGEPQYFLCMLFIFFSFYFWAKLGEEQVDERLLENQQRALRILAPCFASLSFFIIFSLQYDGIPRELIMLGGSLGYAACMILSPALVLYLDKVAE